MDSNNQETALSGPCTPPFSSALSECKVGLRMVGGVLEWGVVRWMSSNSLNPEADDACSLMRLEPLFEGSFSSVSKWESGQKSLPSKNKCLAIFGCFPLVLAQFQGVLASFAGSDVCRQQPMRNSLTAVS